ncbi:hypothetical protein Q7P37_005285 [Cladosporium fusiforme]
MTNHPHASSSSSSSSSLSHTATEPPTTPPQKLPQTPPPPYSPSSPRVPSTTAQLEDLPLDISNYRHEQRADQDLEQASYSSHASGLGRATRSNLRAAITRFVVLVCVLGGSVGVWLMVREARGQGGGEGGEEGGYGGLIWGVSFC